jgi:hypothetical protein
MKYLKLFENFSNNKISKILKNLPTNKDFQIFLNNAYRYAAYEKNLKITRISLIDGYCNDVTIFIKWLFPESEMLMAPYHSFIKNNNKYYDGYNYNGVKNYNDLYFFKNNNTETLTDNITTFFDVNDKIKLLDKLFDTTDKLQILNEELNEEVWYHGTDAEFSEFKEPNDTTKPTSKLGIWFTKDKDYTQYFGNKIISAKLTYKNPYIISSNKWDAIRISHAKDVNYFNNLRLKLISDGYDAFYITGKIDRFADIDVKIPDIIAVFYTNQIQIII